MAAAGAGAAAVSGDVKVAHGSVQAKSVASPVLARTVLFVCSGESGSGNVAGAPVRFRRLLCRTADKAGKVYAVDNEGSVARFCSISADGRVSTLLRSELFAA